MVDAKWVDFKWWMPNGWTFTPDVRISCFVSTGKALKILLSILQYIPIQIFSVNRAPYVSILGPYSVCSNT